MPDPYKRFVAVRLPIIGVYDKVTRKYAPFNYRADAKLAARHLNRRWRAQRYGWEDLIWFTVTELHERGWTM